MDASSCSPKPERNDSVQMCIKKMQAIYAGRHEPEVLTHRTDVCSPPRATSQRLADVSRRTERSFFPAARSQGTTTKNLPEPAASTRDFQKGEREDPAPEKFRQAPLWLRSSLRRASPERHTQPWSSLAEISWAKDIEAVCIIPARARDSTSSALPPSAELRMRRGLKLAMAETLLAKAELRMPLRHRQLAERLLAVEERPRKDDSLLRPPSREKDDSPCTTSRNPLAPNQPQSPVRPTRIWQWPPSSQESSQPAVLRPARILRPASQKASKE